MSRTGGHEARRSIVAQAAGLFRRKGYHLAGIQDILKAAKVSRGAFYFYFPSKEALGEAVLDYNENAVISAIPGFFAGNTWEAGVKNLLHFLFRAEGKATVYATPMANLGLEFAHSNPRLLGRVAHALRGGEAAIAGVLAKAGLAPSEARRRGGTCLAVLEGHIMRLILTKDPRCRRQLARGLRMLGAHKPPERRRRKIARFSAKMDIDFIDDWSIMLSGELMGKRCDLGDKRRQVILCASDVFWKQGYHSTSIQKILDFCRMPKGSFYFYFRSKRELASAVLDVFRQRCNMFFANTLVRADWPGVVERLYAVARHAAVGDVILGCPFGNMGLEFAESDPALGRKVAGILRAIEGGFASVLRRSGSSTPDAKEQAALAVALWQGHLTRLVIYRDLRVADELRDDLLDVAGMLKSK